MGPLLKSFSRLERIHYWVSGLGPARIEACVRQVPHRFLKLPNYVGRKTNSKWSVVEKKFFIQNSTIDRHDAIHLSNGSRGDLHKDDLEGLS